MKYIVLGWDGIDGKALERRLAERAASPLPARPSSLCSVTIAGGAAAGSLNALIPFGCEGASLLAGGRVVVPALELREDGANFAARAPAASAGRSIDGGVEGDPFHEMVRFTRRRP